MFKTLTPEEEAKYRQWAREHYMVFTDICGVYHPVVVDECNKMNEEAAAKMRQG